MNAQTQFSPKQLNIISNALTIAADQYDRDAETMGKVGQIRLMQQFQQQALDARDLADDVVQLDN